MQHVQQSATPLVGKSEAVIGSYKDSTVCGTAGSSAVAQNAVLRERNAQDQGLGDTRVWVRAQKKDGGPLSAFLQVGVPSMT